MKKFMAIYLASREEIDKFMAQPLEKRVKASNEDMKKWDAWNSEHKNDLADKGTMFGKTKHIDASGASDVKNGMTGYTIVKADNYEDAVKIFEGHPYFKFPG